MPALLQTTPAGLYCPAGDFYVDPWMPVHRAVITHAHSDHARPGSEQYLTAAPGVDLLRERLGQDAAVQGLPYGARLAIHQVQVSLHPTGHILGSCQVRLELAGEVWVVSGDYKLAPDATCQAFEPVRCHTFVTESTFGLPIYRWRPEPEIFAALNAWWLANRELGRTSVVYAYSLGKSQRVLAGLDASIGPILVHGAVERYFEIYRAAGVRLPPAERATAENSRQAAGRAIVVAPPSAAGSPWLRKFGQASTAIASGWMQIRGLRRRRAVDRGFALSDHADWDGLLTAIRASGAERVWVTHGYSEVLARWLNENGLEATAIATQFAGELDTNDDVAAQDVSAD